MFFFQNAKLEKVGYRAILVQGIKTFSLTGVFENFSKGEQLQSFFELLPNEVVNDSLSHDKFAQKKKILKSIYPKKLLTHPLQADRPKERTTNKKSDKETEIYCKFKNIDKIMNKMSKGKW